MNSNHSCLKATTGLIWAMRMAWLATVAMAIRAATRLTTIKGMIEIAARRQHMLRISNRPLTHAHTSLASSTPSNKLCEVFEPIHP